MNEKKEGRKDETDRQKFRNVERKKEKEEERKKKEGGRKEDFPLTG